MIFPDCLTVVFVLAVSGTLDPSAGREAFARDILDAFLERTGNAVWDIPAAMNTRQPGAPVAIRLAEWNRAIDLGDASQVAAVPGPVHLIVGFYRPKPEDQHRANLLAIHEVVIAPDTWRKLWGEVQPSDVARLVSKISTGDRVGAHNFALAEVGRLQLQGLRLILDPRISEKERTIACLIPFNVFYTDILGLTRAEIQSAPTLWGEPIAREFDLGAPRAVAARNPKRSVPPAEGEAKVTQAPPPDVSSLPFVRVDPASGQRSVQLPTPVEQMVESLKRAPTTPLPAGTTDAAPAQPPPPVDTGWTRIELDKPVQLGP